MRTALAHLALPLRPGSAAPRVRGALASGFWICMLLAHLPACIAAWRAAGAGEFDALRGLLLVGSQFLFLLKILDVRWLRLPRRGRALLAVILAVVLLHGDVVRRWCAGESVPDARGVTLVFAGGVLGITAAPARTRRVFRRIRPQRTRAALHARLAWALARRDNLLAGRPAAIRVETVRIGRAPPT